MRSSIAHSPPPNYIDPQEDEEVGVNEIPAISAISAERISAAEKVRIIADRLRPWRMSMGDLVLEWVTMAEGSRKALKKKRARELLSKLLEDADILDIYTEEMEKRGIAGASVALTIQGELEELREKESLFGGFDQYADIEQLDLGQCYQAIKTHAPTLEHVITACQEGRRKYSPHKGRAVLIASTLAFGLSRNSANCIPRLLGMYLQANGVKRRVLSVLHGLGLIDGYTTLNRQKERVTQESRFSL